LENAAAFPTFLTARLRLTGVNSLCAWTTIIFPYRLAVLSELEFLSPATFTATDF